MAIYEIPLATTPQTFLTTIGEKQYRFSIMWCNAPEAGWILDIDDPNGNPVVHGIPLVSGIDLLAQYPQFMWGGKLGMYIAGDQGNSPTFENLGSEARMYFVTE